MAVTPPEGFDPNEKYGRVSSPPSCNYLAWLRQKYGPDAMNSNLTAAELKYARRHWGRGFKMEMMPQEYTKPNPHGGVVPVYSPSQRMVLARSAYEQVVKKGIPHPGISPDHWALEYDYWEANGVALSFGKAEYLDWRAGIGPKPWLA